MNVLHVVHYPVFGGPHNQALRLAGPLTTRGYTTTVLLPDEPGNAAERLRNGGVDVVTMPLHRLRAMRSPLMHLRFTAAFWPEVRAIRRLIRQRRIGLVTIGGLVNPHAAIAARLEGVPVVWQILDTRPPMLLRRAMMPLIARLADVVMSTGMGVARVHPGAMSLGERLVPFFPPVDTQAFRPDPSRCAAARAQLGVPPEACLVGSVANLNPQKGIEYLIRATALALRERPELFVRVLGAYTPTHAEYHRRLHAEAQELGLMEGGRLEFVEPGERVAKLLSAFNLFALTSVPRSEGIPTVILEAMACGIPVVATDVGAVREVVENGVTGFVVPALDPEAIADATLRLLSDPAMCARMGEAARQRAVERYDVEVCANVHVQAFEAAIAHRRQRKVSRAQIQAGTSQLHLRSLLACPACRGALGWSSEEARCASCARIYPLIDGIPVMLLDQGAAGHDEIDHHHGHKHRQAEFFDREVAEEFEIRRPHGSPRLYRWLLAQKFARSVAGLQQLLAGGIALTVCGGSGMDAEFLARAGATVISSDISLGAARRSAERAKRYGLPILSLVADVEHLPFPDRSVELVYVHDGLHHLERPEAGIAEMARVASQAVSVTEPAQAAATALAVRLGLALDRDEAGNRVARVTLAEIAGALRRGGLSPVHQERYAMYYRHQPGWVLSALSQPLVFPVARAGWRIANLLVGQWGNKVTVQAARESVEPAGAMLLGD